jgi:hypothetical protein
MKRSKTISLVLITAALASCNKHDPDNEWNAGDRHVYMRSDTSATYSPAYHSHIWYRAFRPYGDYYYGSYYRAGYYSDAISEYSNVGFNSTKSSIVRGGFGAGHMSVSS